MKEENGGGESDTVGGQWVGWGEKKEKVRQEKAVTNTTH